VCGSETSDSVDGDWKTSVKSSCSDGPDELGPSGVDGCENRRLNRTSSLDGVENGGSANVTWREPGGVTGVGSSSSSTSSIVTGLRDEG
jgi:hypothetical protein